MRILLNDVKREDHGAVSGAAKHRAVPNERACLRWRKCELAGFAFRDFCVETQILEGKPVINVGAREIQYNGLTLFQGDLCGAITETVGCDLNVFRRGILCAEIVGGYASRDKRA